MSAVILCCAVFAAEPLSLDNGHIRIEVVPELFAVTYLGVPGGENCLEVLTVSDDLVQGTEWVDVGGLQTDLVGLERDAALRRGPATVTERSEEHLVLEGPVSEATGLRVRKAIHLYPGQAKARYEVVVSGGKEGGREVAVRNVARLQPPATLRVDRLNDSIQILTGGDALAPYVVNSRKYWLIPVPPTSDTRNVIVGAYVSTVVLENRTGLWERRIVSMPPSARRVPQECTFLCLLDDRTRSYGQVLQGEQGVPSEVAPLKFVEVWTLEPRHR